MLSLFKLVNPWILVVFMIALGGSYFYGNHEGYKQGQFDQQQKSQKEIDGLNDTIKKLKQQAADDQARARKRVADISDTADANWQKAQELEKQLEDQQETIVVKWKTKLVPGKCSLSDSTADMVREVLKLNGVGK